MKRIQRWLVIALLGFGMAVPAASAADSVSVDVVASFSVLADMVRQVGGDDVAVTALVKRNSDSHAYAPSPVAAKAIATADLVVVNGLGFEGWLERLIDASGYDGPVAVASRGVNAIPVSSDEHEQGHAHQGKTQPHYQYASYNPHAWLDAANGIIYVRNIADALSRVDPAHAKAYRARSKSYIDRLKAVDAKIKASIAALAKDRRTVVVPHHAFRYYGQAYGIRFLAPLGLSPVATASAGELAELIEAIRAQGIDAVFTENITNPRLIEQVASETGATISGELYSDALSSVDGPASTYIEMLRYNTEQITEALTRRLHPR